MTNEEYRQLMSGIEEHIKRLAARRAAHPDAGCECRPKSEYAIRRDIESKLDEYEACLAAGDLDMCEAISEDIVSDIDDLRQFMQDDDPDADVDAWQDDALAKRYFQLMH